MDLLHAFLINFVKNHFAFSYQKTRIRGWKQFPGSLCWQLEIIVVYKSTFEGQELASSSNCCHSSINKWPLKNGTVWQNKKSWQNPHGIFLLWFTQMSKCIMLSNLQVIQVTIWLSWNCQCQKHGPRPRFWILHLGYDCSAWWDGFRTFGLTHTNASSGVEPSSRHCALTAETSRAIDTQGVGARVFTCSTLVNICKKLDRQQSEFPNLPEMPTPLYDRGTRPTFAGTWLVIVPVASRADTLEGSWCIPAVTTVTQ